MYELKMNNDEPMLFVSIYDLETYLCVSCLPMLCLATLDDINKKGKASCVIDGNTLTITKLTIENEKA